MSQTGQADSNRRSSYRRRSRQNVRVTCTRGRGGAGANVALSLLDASQTGVRLVAREVLEKGQEVSLHLQGPGDISIQGRAGTVAWTVPGLDGSCCVGVHLQERLPYPVLIRLTEL